MVEFLNINLLTERKFKDAEEKEVTRLYSFQVPYAAPYEEIRGVITEMAQRIDELEKEGKKREEEQNKAAEEVAAEVVN